VPKEKPRVNIEKSSKPTGASGGLSQGDIERRTGLLRCYLSRVENGHTVPSLETLGRLPRRWIFRSPDFFPGTETPRDRETQKMLGELSQTKFASSWRSALQQHAFRRDKRLVLAMIRKMATMLRLPYANRSRAADGLVRNF